MKKVFFLILISLFVLVGCGESNELEDFADKYNRGASNDGIQKLSVDSFGEIEIEDGRGWQKLQETDGYYIDAKYENGEDLSGYYLVIDEDQPFDEREGDGYRAALSIAKAVEVNAGDFVKEFGKALKEGSHSYVENDYLISFSYPKESGVTSVGMIINYDKK